MEDKSIIQDSLAFTQQLQSSISEANRHGIRMGGFDFEPNETMFHALWQHMGQQRNRVLETSHDELHEVIQLEMPEPIRYVVLPVRSRGIFIPASSPAGAAWKEYAAAAGSGKRSTDAFSAAAKVTAELLDEGDSIPSIASHASAIAMPVYGQQAGAASGAGDGGGDGDGDASGGRQLLGMLWGDMCLSMAGMMEEHSLQVVQKEEDSNGQYAHDDGETAEVEMQLKFSHAGPVDGPGAGSEGAGAGAAEGKEADAAGQPRLVGVEFVDREGSVVAMVHRDGRLEAVGMGPEGAEGQESKGGEGTFWQHTEVQMTQNDSVEVEGGSVQKWTVELLLPLACLQGAEAGQGLGGLTACSLVTMGAAGEQGAVEVRTAALDLLEPVQAVKAELANETVVDETVSPEILALDPDPAAGAFGGGGPGEGEEGEGVPEGARGTGATLHEAVGEVEGEADALGILGDQDGDEDMDEEDEEEEDRAAAAQAAMDEEVRRAEDARARALEAQASREEELREQAEGLRAELDYERARAQELATANDALHRKLSAFFAERQKSDQSGGGGGRGGSAGGGPRAASGGAGASSGAGAGISNAERERRYKEKVDELREVLRGAETLRGSHQDRLQGINLEKARKEGALAEVENRFADTKKEAMRRSKALRTGKGVSRAEERKLLEEEAEEVKNLSGSRVLHILTRMQVEALQAKLATKETVGGGLALIDFEQLRIENATAHEKIEDRQDELRRLRAKTTATVQVLTHVKEKLQFVQRETTKYKEEARKAELAVGEQRARLARGKRVRERSKADNEKRAIARGFAHEDALAVDFEKRRVKGLELGREVESMKGRYEQLRLQARRANAEAETVVRTAQAGLMALPGLDNDMSMSMGGGGNSMGAGSVGGMAEASLAGSLTSTGGGRRPGGSSLARAGSRALAH